MSLHRFDTPSKIESFERTPEGYLRVRATIGKSGVFTYKTPNGIRREYRPPEEVVNDQSIASFVGKVVTNEHPGYPEAAHLVDIENTSKFRRGTVLSASAAGDGRVDAWIQIEDSELIAAIESRKQTQISPGYTLGTIEDTPGISPEGERYDAIQRRVSGNHVAVTRLGRQGPDVSIRFDSADAGFEVEAEPETQRSVPQAPAPKQEKSTMQVRFDGFVVELEDRDGQIVNKALADRDSKLESEKARADSLAKERDELQARADQADAKIKELEASVSPEAMRARMDSRLELERNAIKILGDEKSEDLRKASDEDVKKAVVANKFPNVTAKLDSCSADYLEGMYAAALEQPEVRKPATDGAKLWQTLGGADLEAVRTDSAPTESNPYAKALGHRYSGFKKEAN